MRDVEGKVAFITGGASGIGYGMARAFLDAGMKVVVADLLQQHLDEVAAQHPGANNLHLIKVDVTDRPGMERAAQETIDVFGKIHVLCNNAGVAARGLIDEHGYEDWDYVMGVCVGGTINGLVNFLPKMKAQGEGGHIVNTSSMAGMIPVPAFVGSYSTAKFAVRGMSDALRLALVPYKIGVSVLCPGHVATRAMSGGGVYRSTHDSGQQTEDTPPPGVAGMDPRFVGDVVLKAIHDNQLYIFPHGEFKEEVAGYFERMLDAFATDNIEPARREMEERRAKMTLETLKAAQEIDN